MMPAEILTTFFAIAVVLALAPGPDNFYVLTQSALRGPLAGLFVTLGLCTGLVGHTAAVALGVAALLKTSTLAFAVLKVLGACYLLYLAWRSFRAEPIVSEDSCQATTDRWRLYRRGIAMNLSNPKVAVFFLALLPQFASPERGSMPFQLVMLGGVFIAATLLVFGTIALITGRIGKLLLRSARAQNILNGIAGVVFAALAARLATSRL